MIIYTKDEIDAIVKRIEKQHDDVKLVLDGAIKGFEIAHDAEVAKVEAIAKKLTDLKKKDKGTVSPYASRDR